MKNLTLIRGVIVEIFVNSSKFCETLALILWCSSLRHHYFCTTNFIGSILFIFLVPLTEMFVLMICKTEFSNSQNCGS